MKPNIDSLLHDVRTEKCLGIEIQVTTLSLTNVVKHDLVLKCAVVIPCFNITEVLGTLVKQLEFQTEPPQQLIFVDDASKDGTADQLLAHARTSKLLSKGVQFLIISLPENLGPGVARNIGIQKADLNLIAFLDADDRWIEEKLSVQTRFHLTTHSAFSCTGFQHGGNSVRKSKTGYKDLLKNNVVNTSTVMFDKAQVSVEFSSSHKSEDYVAWLQVAKAVRIDFIDKLLAERVETGGLSSNKFAMAQRRWEIYRGVEKLGFLPSAYYFMYYMATGLSKHLKT